MIIASAGNGVVKEAALYVSGGNIIYITFLLSILIHNKNLKNMHNLWSVNSTSRNYPREMIMDIQGFPYKDIILGVLLISKNYKPPMLPITGEKFKKFQYSHSVEYQTLQMMEKHKAFSIARLESRLYEGVCSNLFVGFFF